MDKISDVRKRTGRIEELIEKLENTADSATLGVVRELVQSLLELYGAGLERVTEIVARAESGRSILTAFGRDELLGSLLASSGLHPIDFETRVHAGLEKLRAGGQGTVELLSLEGGVVRLRARPSSTCGSASASFQKVVEDTMYEAVPDLTRLDIEMRAEPAVASGFVPLAKLRPLAAPATDGAGRKGARL